MKKLLSVFATLSLLFFIVSCASSKQNRWLSAHQKELSRLANRIIAAAPGLAKGGREEGSILGGFGRVLDGDNS